MTSGERMVWAAEFVRARAECTDAADAAYRASCAVWALRELRDVCTGTDHSNELVDDMLSNGEDR